MNRGAPPAVFVVVERIWVWGTTAVVAVLIFAACGGGGGGDDGSATRATAAPGTSTTVSTEDIDMTAADFPNINTLTKVHNHFVGNLLGHLDAALAVANSPTGGIYPVGTLIQLVPQEAMVKRRAGWNAGSHDWEFFSLDVSPTGTKILDPRVVTGPQPLRPGLLVVSREGGRAVGPRVREGARLRSVAARRRADRALAAGRPRPPS